MLSSNYEQSNSKQRFFLENSLLHFRRYSSVEIRRVRIVLITAAAEASCCCILVSGVMVAAEMCDTNNKRSLNLGEFKKTLFKPLKIRPLCFKSHSN